MSYTPKVWANDAAGATPITAAELNRIELGVDKAYGRSPTATANATAATPTETIIASWDVPANELAANALLNLRWLGHSTTAATQIYKIRFGTAGTTADPVLCTFQTTGGFANSNPSIDALLWTPSATTMSAGGQVMQTTSATASVVYGVIPAALANVTVNLTVANKVTVGVVLSVASVLTTRAAALSWQG